MHVEKMHDDSGVLLGNVDIKKSLLDMIVMDSRTFCLVEGDGFKNFVNDLCKLM